MARPYPIPPCHPLAQAPRAEVEALAYQDVRECEVFVGAFP